MILHDTPYDLVLQNMRDEAEKVEFFRRKEQNKIEKRLSREYVTFPFYHKAEYVVPKSRNKYIVWFYVANADDARIKFGNFLEIFSRNGGRTVYLYKLTMEGASSGNRKTPELAVYTDHFFRRYRERFSKFSELGTTDLIIRYMSRNYYHVEGLDFSKLNLNFEKYPNGAVHQVKDGIVFVSMQEVSDGRGITYRVLRHNTFVSYDLLKVDQQDGVINDDDVRKGLLKEFGIASDPDEKHKHMTALYKDGEKFQRECLEILEKFAGTGYGIDKTLKTLLSKIATGLRDIQEIIDGNKEIR